MGFLFFFFNLKSLIYYTSSAAFYVKIKNKTKFLEKNRKKRARKKIGCHKMSADVVKDSTLENVVAF